MMTSAPTGRTHSSDVGHLDVVPEIGRVGRGGEPVVLDRADDREALTLERVAE